MSQRLLWISHIVPFPPKAGVLLRSYNLLKGVAAQHRVTLIAFVQEVWIKTHFTDLDSGLQACRKELESFCAAVLFIPIRSMQRPMGQYQAAMSGLFRGGGYMTQWLQSAEAHRRIQELARSQSFDVVHFDTVGLDPFRQYFPGVPATLGHHNIESHMLARRADNEPNPAKRLYFRMQASRLKKYERRIASEYALHVTCSQVDLDRLAAIVPGVRGCVIPNGVDCEYFRPQGLSEEPASIVFVGTMNWYPNVDAMMFFLAEVWPALKRARPQLTFDIVGANPPAALAEAASKAQDVTLHGFVNDIRPMLEVASLFVCPIRDGGGTKLKVLDAFAMHKCTVAHPIACEGIDVTDEVNVVLAVEPEEWVRKMISLLDEPARRVRVGAAAQRLAQEQYSFAAIAARFSDVLDEVAAQGAVAGNSNSVR